MKELQDVQNGIPHHRFGCFGTGRQGYNASGVLSNATSKDVGVYQTASVLTTVPINAPINDEHLFNET